MIPPSEKWNREFLEKQLAAIEAKLNDCLIEGWRQRRNLLVTEVVSSSSKDPHSHAILVVDEELTLGLLGKCRKPLADLCIAHYFIRDSPDLYGRCLGCGGEIGQKRLDAISWAVLCVTCQDALEKGLAE